MFDGIVSARLQDIEEPDKITLNIHIGMLYGITYACLCGEIHHHRRTMLGKHIIDQRFISEVSAHKEMLDRRGLRRLFDQTESVFLQLRIIIIIHGVKRDHCSRIQLV